MKIVVLAGGTSTERTVSITSGTGICKAFFAALRMWTGRIRFRQSMMWTQHQNICQHLTTGLNR